MELLNLEIVTPMGVIYDGKARQVNLPGSEGDFGVLAGHAGLLSLLNAGVIVIEKEDKSEIAVVIDSGYVKVEESKTTCIVEGAVAVDSDHSEVLSEDRIHPLGKLHDLEVFEE
jgi:F-type H+-transporting ATPase subunit epsilon